MTSHLPFSVKQPCLDKTDRPILAEFSPPPRSPTWSPARCPPYPARKYRSQRYPVEMISVISMKSTPYFVNSMNVIL